MKKYIISFQNSVQAAITYRVSVYMGFFTMLIPFVVKNYIWISAIEYADKASISGYDVNAIILYNAYAMIFGNLIRTNIQYEIANEIKDGGLNRYLVQPINHMLFWISKFVGKKCIDLVHTFIFGILVLAMLSLTMSINVEYNMIFLTIVVLTLSLVLNFLLFYLISFSSFWFLEISSFFTAINFLIMFLSGEVIPLDMLPSRVGDALQILPFSYSVYFPIEVILNRASIVDIGFKISMQFTWIIILLIAIKILWPIGLKRYEAVGG